MQVLSLGTFHRKFNLDPPHSTVRLWRHQTPKLSIQSSTLRETAELSCTRPPSNSNDLYETYEPTSSYYHTQRQQHPTPLRQETTPDPAERLLSSVSSLQRLRRTPKFETAPVPEPRKVHLAAVSIGFSPRPSPLGDDTRPQGRANGIIDRSEPHRRRFPSQDLIEDLDERSSYLSPSPSRSLRPFHRSHRHQTHPIVQVSKRTHSAILFALEEALRQPNPFTPDLAEESASMADFVAGSGSPPTSNGNVLDAPRRPTAAPAPTSSPSGIKGPRMIMQERAAREARQKAEAQKQRRERERSEQEAQPREESQRNAAARRTAGVASGQGSSLDNQHPVDLQGQGRTTPDRTRHQEAAPNTPQQSHQRINASRFAANQQLPSQIYSAQTPHQPQAQPQSHPQQNSQPTILPGQTGETPGSSGAAKPRNSFPHAFERWETLSAHWEGLTSYWIRKLEQNKDDLNRDPVSQQLARQVTDLSAAGANLFHAVVELQRLRASSERKFQRWFFETRAELERAQEVNSMLENALDQEHRNREEAIREALEKDQGTSLAQKQLAEMRKELAISKDEARRAWEELGRREQAERDRTLSLQSGLPTILGGVQVVPMTQGVPGRQHQAEYPQGYPAEQMQPSSSQQSPGPVYQNSHPEVGPEQAYSYGGGPSQSGQSEGEYVMDVRGIPILDVHGNKIPFAAPSTSYSGSDAEVEEYDTPATTNPPSGSHLPTSSSADGGQVQNYSGQGYAAPGWETLPRHHHPTRLSDVIEEEDERSRTSASQISRV